VWVIVRVGQDRDVKGADPVALDALDPQLDRLEPEAVGYRAQLVLGTARIEQRPEQHVSRQPADAVQIREHSRPLAIRAAIVPAPSPSSIPTTASAAAHDVSIAFSAVRPLSAVP
jgi:hypothetical protein